MMKETLGSIGMMMITIGNIVKGNPVMDQVNGWIIRKTTQMTLGWTVHLIGILRSVIMNGIRVTSLVPEHTDTDS